MNTKNKIVWALAIFVLITIGQLLYFSSLSYVANYVKTDEVKTEQIFTETLVKEASNIPSFPAPRVLKFMNAEGHTTFRVVTITDYSLSKEDGICASYHIVFSGNEKKACAPRELIKHDDLQNDLTNNK